ncbi:MAG: CRISPR-associated helicase Cas3', partial [Bacteroidetes bacterium]|nr:CRISPR-associated helicase Cas3' [Bacteroidota bacterium]
MAGIMEHALGKSDGTTLLEHIEDCLGVYSQLKNTLPSLPDVASLSNFWELLFYIIYFHDWGKCHTEFQKVLKGVKANFWNYQRHEIYSVPFVDKLNLNDEEKILIQRAIIGHHKTFFELIEKLKSEEDLELEYQLKWKRENKYNREYHPENFIENLRHNLNYDYLKYLIKNFGDVYQKFTANARKELTKEVDFQAQQHPVKSIAESTHKTVFHPDQKSYWQNILLWGSTKICDHYGSAKIKKINSFTEKDFNFLSHLEQKLKKEGQGFYSHQKKCFEKTGNCILIAPTGSGKTEAAIGWLKKQICESQGRAYYILPYTASINAMHQRLTKDFSKETEVKGAKLIGIQHGKLTQYIASLYEETGEQNVSIMKRNDEIKNLRDLYKKMIYPLKIATPFQVLKYCYGVKGFEMGFTELVGAKLIFDEIHAYDEITFAQILTGLQYFIKHFKCKVMVMTATLPSFMLNELQQVLEVQIPIKADSNLLKKFNRHRIEIKEGIIFDQIEKIKFLFEQKKRLIIVCNTVKTAQEIFTLLKESVKISENEIALLHSRFNSLDRNKKEKQALNP